MRDPQLVKAAVNALDMIDAFYKWLDRVDAAGGVSSISGVAACHAMLKSMRATRNSLDETIVQPLRKALEENADG